MSVSEAELVRLTRRVRDEPRSTVFVALADALRRAGRFGEGLQVLREGFRAHPEHAAGKVVLARIHLEMGRRAHAEEVLGEVVVADPENLAAAALLARIRVEDGRLVEARPLVELLRAAGHPDASGELARALRSPTDATLRGLDAFDHPAVAARFAAGGHYGRARAVWRRIVEANPDAAWAGDQLAELERTMAGLGVLDDEAHLPDPVDTPPLPGLDALHRALADDAAERPAPAGEGAVARWARQIWRAT